MDSLLVNDHPAYATDEYDPQRVTEPETPMEYNDDADAVGYTAIIKAASAIATCAHAEPRVKKLAERYLRREIMRWGEMTEEDDD